MVSGGAFGVDVLAHQAGLDHGAPTTLVSAAGIDGVYPIAHAEVFDAVAETGAIVSEYPPREAVDHSRLLARNRLVAAMSRQLVIPEAGLRSGTLSTATPAPRTRSPTCSPRSTKPPTPNPATSAATSRVPTPNTTGSEPHPCADPARIHLSLLIIELRGELLWPETPSSP
ncbi:DNA-processing protein DprA [Nocardia asiatica]